MKELPWGRSIRARSLLLLIQSSIELAANLNLTIFQEFVQFYPSSIESF